MDEWVRQAHMRNDETRIEDAPTIGERLTRHHFREMDEETFIARFGRAPLEVAEVVPIEDRPGWVKVYVERAATGTRCWDDLALRLC